MSESKLVYYYCVNNIANASCILQLGCLAMNQNAGKEAAKTTRVYKVVILGDGGVGKSALVMQYVSHRFPDYHDPTIEDAYQQQARIDGEPARLDILDTAGQPEFTAMREQYMRKGEGFVLCYSITDRRSFDDIVSYKDLIDRVRNHEHIPFIITGNKCDLEENRKVSAEDGAALARQYNVPFYETSAAWRQCVDDVFHGLVREIRLREKQQQSIERPTVPQGSRFNRLTTFLKDLHVKRVHKSK